jgi:hypothetical protein
LRLSSRRRALPRRKPQIAPRRTTGTITGIRRGAGTTTAKFRIIVHVKLNNNRPQICDRVWPIIFGDDENTKRGADGSPFRFAVSSQKVRCKA